MEGRQVKKELIVGREEMGWEEEQRIVLFNTRVGDYTCIIWFKNYYKIMGESKG